MGKSFFARAVRLIEKADLVLEVLDARFAVIMRNDTLEGIVYGKRKKLLFVLQKSDLLSTKALHAVKKSFPAHSAVFVSARERKGISLLKQAIAGALHGKGKVAVLGYPNVGKSSLINALAGRKAAPTSIVAGFTRGERLVNVTEDIQLLDSPGVIPLEEHDEFKLFLFQAKTPEQLRDAEYIALRFIDFCRHASPGTLQEAYGIGDSLDAELSLEAIAVKKNRLKKGGVPDTGAAAKMLLWDYQKGVLQL